VTETDERKRADNVKAFTTDRVKGERVDAERNILRAQKKSREGA